MAQLLHAQLPGYASIIHAPLIQSHAATPTPRPRMRETPAAKPMSGTGDYYALGNSPTTRPDNPNAKWVWTNPEQTQGEWRVPLTAQGRKERNALVNDIIKGVQSGRFSQTEIDSLMGQFKDAEDRIRVADMMREPELSSEEKFNQNTFTNKDGLIFKTDGTLVYDPNKNKETGPTDEEKSAAKLEADRKKYILGQVEAARKAWDDGVKAGTINVVDEEIDNPRYGDDGDGRMHIKNPNYGKSFDPSGALKAAESNWNAVYGAPAPAPQKNTTTGDPALGGGYVEMADTLDRAEILADGKIGVTRGYKPPSFGNRARLNPYSPIGDAIPSQPVPTPTPTPSPAQTETHTADPYDAYKKFLRK